MRSTVILGYFILEPLSVFLLNHFICSTKDFSSFIFGLFGWLFFFFCVFSSYFSEKMME